MDLTIKLLTLFLDTEWKQPENKIVLCNINDYSCHIVMHHKLDYDLLKHINNNPKVVEIRGIYMGGMASIGLRMSCLQTYAESRDSSNPDWDSFLKTINPIIVIARAIADCFVSH